MVEKISDAYGNELSFNPQNQKLIIKYNGDKPRCVGRIQDRTLICSRRNSKHLHKKINAYGFCKYILNYAKSFHKILIMDLDDDKEVGLEIELLDARKSAIEINDGMKGFHKQLFIPLSKFYEVDLSGGVISEQNQFLVE